MKQFLKTIIWIAIIGVVGYGIYNVLPEYPHNFIKGVFQPHVDAQAEYRIGQIQNLTNADVNGVTYKTILEANTTMPTWVYEVGPNAEEYVIFYGNGASLNLKDWEADYRGKLYTSCSIKVQFKIVGKSVDIYPYINGTLMYLDDVQYSEKNKEIKKDIFQQLSTGMHE